MNSLIFNEISKDTILTKSYFQLSNINLMDILECTQGINWSALNHNRENLRATRIASIHGTRDQPESTLEKNERKLFHNNKTTDVFYQFSKFYKDIPMTVNHFQLRKSVIMLNEKELIYIRTFGIEKINLVTDKRNFLVLFSNEENMDYSKIISIDAYQNSRGDIMIVGGKINSSIVIYKILLEDLNNVKIKSECPKYSVIRKVMVEDEESHQLINNVKFLEEGNKLMVCGNDAKIRILDINDSLNEITSYEAGNPVNHASFSYDENILAAVGDFYEAYLFDTNTAQLVETLKGHNDFGFSVKFKPNNSFILATGNQDSQCKLWDLRNLANSNHDNICFDTIYGYNDSIGDLQFLNNNLISFFENTDSLHIYDINKKTIQTLSFFGRSTGFAYNKATKKIFLGLCEDSFHGIYCFQPIRSTNYSLNNLII